VVESRDVLRRDLSARSVLISRARLDKKWEVEVDERRPRVDPVPEGSPYTHDAMLRAKRRG